LSSPNVLNPLPQERQISILYKKLLFQNEEIDKLKSKLAIANKELTFQKREKAKRAKELAVANEKYDHAIKVFTGKGMTDIKQKDEIKKLKSKIL